ncbi:MAG: hypothetical protein AMJ81_14185 [Phycisphaerae bacterium SM23_33]|nr:MAG: hypothetical protein AMJ81_14185 [Phycisphaerae bacterium SM23_33]
MPDHPWGWATRPHWWLMGALGVSGQPAGTPGPYPWDWSPLQDPCQAGGAWDMPLWARGAIDGDANLDRTVDGLDYNTWSLHYLQTGWGWTGGNFNCDDLVDGLDYSYWAIYHGVSYDLPEPACLMLLALTAWPLLFRRSR